MFGKKRRHESKEMNLNITSLMDILTIILIFLIQSFASTEQEVEPPKEFPLPLSSSERAAKLAVKVTISEKTLSVEDKAVTKLRKGALSSRDLDSQKHIIPLLKELKRQKNRLQAGLIQTKIDEEETEVVYLEAARGTPYELIDRVLKTAAQAGFTKFRLAVNRSA